MTLAAFLGAFASGIFAGAAICTWVDLEDRSLAWTFGGFAGACLVPAFALLVMG